MKRLKTLQTVFIATFSLFSYNTMAQDHALALNGAYIVMNGGSQTDNIKLVINQPSTNGIVRLSGGGHIHSENQYNSVQWITNNELGSYIFPFGVAGNSSDYIPFTFNKTAGNNDISISTWGTNQENSPKPDISNVGAVTNMTGTVDSVKYAVDRFWDIQATGATGDLTFSYLGTENTTLNPSASLMGQYWDGSYWNAQMGAGNMGVNTGVGTVGPIVDQTYFSPWTLTTACPSDITTTTFESTITANAASPATYQWVDCNNGYAILPGETNQSFTATNDGDYAVIISENGCSDTSACVTITNVGLDYLEKDTRVAIYPNPTKNTLNIELTHLDSSSQLKIINNLGKTVYRKPLSNHSNTIDLESFAKGVYTIMISSDNEIITRRIIKQ